MSRLTRLLTLLLTFLLQSGGANSAEEMSYGKAVGLKLGSGLSNLTMGIGELPKNMISTTNEANVMLGVTGGVLKGMLHFMGRTLAGMVDVLTFPISTQPIPHAPFIWDKWNTETTYGPYFKLQPSASQNPPGGGRQPPP